MFYIKETSSQVIPPASFYAPQVLPMSNVIKLSFLPSFRAAKGGWSSAASTGWVNMRAILTQMHWRKCMAAWTHPGIASLADPLFAAQKEGKLHSSST